VIVGGEANGLRKRHSTWVRKPTTKGEQDYTSLCIRRDRGVWSRSE